MKLISFISNVWEFISRVARVIVEVDDALIEIKWFFDWLKGDEEVKKKRD